MIEIAPNWMLHTDVGPEWVFFRLATTSKAADPSPPLAEKAWGEIEQHRIYRVVIELDANVMLTSHLVGQIVLIHKRCHQLGGVTRICGLDTQTYGVIQAMQLTERFPNYANRRDAVMGHLPSDG